MKKTALVFIVFALAISGCNLPVPNPAPAIDSPTLTPSPIPPTVTPKPTATTTATPEPAQLVCVDEACIEGATFDYLIVTRPLFVEALAPFINWKTANGFRVGLVTVEWLDASFEGRHMAERIKTGMHALRKSAGVVYVLLVGDTAIRDWEFDVQYTLASYKLSPDWNVPTGFYRRIETDPARDVLPSDAYFVEDKDWDPQNTGLNPIGDQSSGQGTFEATLFLGRWMVRSPEQIGPIFNKTKAVVPASSIFFSADNTLSDGVNAPCQSGFPPPRYQYFSCYLDMEVSARQNIFEDHTPWLATESMFTDISDPGEVSAFREKFFNFEGVVVFSYHGEIDCWVLEKDVCTGIEATDFKTVFPLLVTQSCTISAFYVEGTPSLSELLFQHPTGPAIVVEPPNPYLFLQYLAEGQPVGKALWSGASTYVYFPNPITLFGDPSLVVLQPPP